MRDRPTIVVVVAVFLFAATAIASIVGTSLLFPGTVLDRVWELNEPAYAGFKPLGKAAGIMLLLLAVGTVAAGAGLLRGKKWAWWLAVAVFAANGFGDLVNLFMTRDLVKSGAGALIAATFLFCLFRPSVAAFFKTTAQGKIN